VVLFDDYEKGANGSVVSTQAGSAQVGQWSDAVGAITYSTTYAHSGAQSGESNWANSGSGSLPQTQLTFPGSNQVFLSWWQYVPTGTVIPGTTNPSLGGTNWKTFWLWADPFPDSDHLTVYLNDTTGPGGWSYLFAGDDTSMSYNSGSPSGYLTSYLTKGVWNRYSFYFYGDPSAGIVKAYEVSSNQGFHTTLNSSGLTTMRSGQTWNELTLPGYGRQDSNAQTYVDDVYLATGSGAQARVEIGDKSVYTSCTNLAMTTPTAWSTGSVTTTIRQGSFTAGQSAYLFVIDSSGNVSSGYPVTIGSGGSSSGGSGGGTTTNNPPTVSITTPTTQPTYASAQNTVTVAGVATDTKGIASVSWTNSLGGSGTATNVSGTWSSWSITGIPLQTGQNVITVTATDTAGLTGTGQLAIGYSSSPSAWSANNQTGDPIWKDSSVTYCARILVEGSQVMQSGSTIKLGFQGRTSGNYTVKEVSIAQKDPNVTGNVVRGTWTKVTFDSSSVSSWSTHQVTVSGGTEKLSDPIAFNLQPGKDYYVTFKLVTPAVYLNPPASFRELYFYSTDESGQANWSGLGYEATQDFHALSHIYVVQ
jgi:hypothetical protein